MEFHGFAMGDGRAGGIKGRNVTLTSGERLGPYEIQSPIGAGGMGEVYRARDTRLDRTVAIKLLPAAFADRPERRQRFQVEARAISSLQHPHICTLFDIGEEDGQLFLVLEYLEGETLEDRLTHGALPANDVLRYASQIASALDHAHRARHRPSRSEAEQRHADRIRREAAGFRPRTSARARRRGGLDGVVSRRTS